MKRYSDTKICRNSGVKEASFL